MQLSVAVCGFGFVGSVSLLGRFVSGHSGFVLHLKSAKFVHQEVPHPGISGAVCVVKISKPEC